MDFNESYTFRSLIQTLINKVEILNGDIICKIHTNDVCNKLVKHNNMLVKQN